MKKVIVMSFMIQLLFAVATYSQFNGFYGTINIKPAYGHQGPGTVLGLGDQNGDGYDDFLITTGKYPNPTYTLHFFRGGPVIDIQSHILNFLYHSAR